MTFASLFGDGASTADEMPSANPSPFRHSAGYRLRPKIHCVPGKETQYDVLGEYAVHIFGNLGRIGL